MEHLALRIELAETKKELDLQKEQRTGLQEEIEMELGGMMKTGSVPKNLCADFDYHIRDEKVDHGTDRYIKIQCPGVRHSDVYMESIFNGCIVSIDRQAARGVEAVKWERRFQFRPSEGMFEFKEDQATLDRGYLTLVLRAFEFQRRPFRFPKHFDLAETDVDGTWEYPQDNATAGNATDPSVHGRGTAPGRLEMNAVAAAEFDGHAAEGLGAETSGSPIDTVDYEATCAAIVAHHTISTPGASDIADGGMPEVVAYQGSPEVTGDDDGAQKAVDSEGSSEGFEKVYVNDVTTVAEEGM
jgi:hypothetical protein